MAWRRLGDKPISEPIMAYFTGVYMRLLAPIGYEKELR